jgi:Uri superfamily endonuclease
VVLYEVAPTFPLTSSLYAGVSVFIPTLPVGFKLMCIENLKHLKLYNGTICNLESIDTEANTITVNSNIFTFSEFIKNFEPAFAQTIYKYQGATITEKFCIHELNIMTKRELYTSLSRGKTLSDISLNYSTKTFYNSDVSKAIEAIIKVNNDVDEKYINGKIYKISWLHYVYIGSTFRSLEERFNEHKKSTTGSNFIKHLKGAGLSAKIELIKDYPCKSQKELMFEEKIQIDLVLDDDSVEVLNTMMTKTKSKLVDKEIIQSRLEMINVNQQDKYHIVENVTKQIYRYQAKDVNGKTIDISMKWTDGKRSQAEAYDMIVKKVDGYYMN